MKDAAAEETQVTELVVDRRGRDGDGCGRGGGGNRLPAASLAAFTSEIDALPSPQHRCINLPSGALAAASAALAFHPSPHTFFLDPKRVLTPDFAVGTQFSLMGFRQFWRPS